MKFCVLGGSGFLGSHWRRPSVPLEEAEVVVNFRYTTSRQELSETARLVQGKKVIHVSSMAVYEPFPEGPARVDQPLQPPLDDVYACSKLAAEHILRPAVILRPSIIFGPRSRWWTENFRRTGVRAPRNATGRIQPLYVGDLIRLIESNPEPGVYNVPGPETLTWKEYFDFYATLPRQPGPVPPELEAQMRAGYFARDRLLLEREPDRERRPLTDRALHL